MFCIPNVSWHCVRNLSNTLGPLSQYCQLSHLKILWLKEPEIEPGIFWSCSTTELWFSPKDERDGRDSRQSWALPNSCWIGLAQVFPPGLLAWNKSSCRWITTTLLTPISASQRTRTMFLKQESNAYLCVCLPVCLTSCLCWVMILFLEPSRCLRGIQYMSPVLWRLMIWGKKHF